MTSRAGSPATSRKQASHTSSGQIERTKFAPDSFSIGRIPVNENDLRSSRAQRRSSLSAPFPGLPFDYVDEVKNERRTASLKTVLEKYIHGAATRANRMEADKKTVSCK
ncbi:hypothetical protein BVI434_1330022 [Burkholderia vietnamiensis]|nr:hypothetical protein BVI434_1330022 [Burkholderia vietnamiensis]